MMKKFLLLSALSILFGSAIMAQADTSFNKKSHDTTYVVHQKPKLLALLGGDGIYLRDSTWKIGGYIGVSLSQTAVFQWSAGGANSFAFLLAGSGYANYKKKKVIVDNSLDMKWGMVANGLIRNKALLQANLQKNIDVLALKSAFGYEIDGTHLFVAAKVAFESQFSPTYDYSQTDTASGRFRRYTVSKFAAPAILTLGPGLTWKPKDYFTLFFSPVEGKMTFVTPDDPARDTATVGGIFSNRYYSDVDETRFGLKRGKSFMGELGLELDLLFQKDIVKNVNWKSHLNVFVSYMNANYNQAMPFYYADADSMGTTTIAASTLHIPVIKWDNDLVFKINKFLSATLTTKFIYQYNSQVPIDTHNNATQAKGPDGITDKDKNGNPILTYGKLQIFEQFGLGLSFKF
ncbi:MAG: hypothetical protein JWO06_2525 [Bacteroidota bacterium]|nr:hypothetical protein [Bacteroidota bacterium]